MATPISPRIHAVPVDPQDVSLTESRARRIAAHRFDKPQADVVILTCDNVEFHVRSQILIEASPVFETMLSLPQPPSGGSEANAATHPCVVELVEDAKTIETLLRICYPIMNPAVNRDPPEYIESTLGAALKYELEFPTAILTERLLSIASQSPLVGWEIACRLRLERVARHAATCTLGLLPPLDIRDLGTTEGVSAGHYFRLREFHRLRGAVSQDYRLLEPAPSLLQGLEDLSAAPSETDPMPYPDLICRSSDGAGLLVNKGILASFSPVFRERIENALATGDDSVLPVLQLDDKGAALSGLFRFCTLLSLGVAEALPSDAYILADILALSRKSRRFPGTHDVVKNDPLRAYFAAISRDLDDKAKEAAQATEDIAIEGVYVLDMEHARALPYHKLLSYHEACRGVAKRTLNSHEIRLTTDAVTGGPMAALLPPVPMDGSTVPRPSDELECGHHHGGFSSDCSWVRRYVASACIEVPTHVFEAATTARAWCRRCRPLVGDLFKVTLEV
ncbi:hypothetical protein C8Q79DRAFT_1113943 [Trametes meyenii]|nr:hypothetical protein C8Q79DRAFT_1113943 [Trametes meyenii]